MKPTIATSTKLKRRKPGGKNGQGYLFLLPATAVLLLISIYPVLRGIWMSLTNYNMLRPGQTKFVGFANYAELLADKEFLGTLGFTFVYTFSVVAISYVCGLALALALNRNIHFRGLFRTIFLLPWVIPAVVAVTNWSWLLNDQIGFINYFLQWVGLVDKPILFLADYRFIRLTVIVVSVWKQMPFMMITILAGLQSVPEELYEAAAIDGAGFWSCLGRITLPMIRPVTYISTLMSFLWTFNTFENIWLLTAGGPNGHTYILPILSYYTAFVRQDISYASAIATAMIVVLLLLSFLYVRLSFRGERGLKKGAVKGD